jgi:hypothetical protein
MSERIMVVTGAFATHTTKLYNYYVCPANWDIIDIKYIAVNYLSQLYYMGKIENNPIRWSFNEVSQRIMLPSSNEITNEIRNDLEQFKTLLRGENHYLFRLKSIIGGCDHDNLSYKLKGAFTQGHRYFNQLSEMLAEHQGLSLPNNIANESNESPTSINDFEVNL